MYFYLYLILIIYWFSDSLFQIDKIHFINYNVKCHIHKYRYSCPIPCFTLCHWKPGPVVRYLHKSINKSITTFNGETIPLTEQWVHTMPLAFLFQFTEVSKVESKVRSGYKKTYHALWKNLNRYECIPIWNEFIPELFSTIFHNFYLEWIHSGLEWIHSA